MANVRPILDEVWSELRQVNVVDDLAIIEYIAALLIEDKSWPFDEKLRPQKPRVRYNPNDESLKNQLHRAAEEINSKDIDKGTAELFDQHVLFYSSRYQEKGNYPTPRYIVDFMLEILEIEKVHDLADFTCGSGGFLVHRYQHEQSSKSPKRGLTIGVDISPDWIKIAQTNIFLHQLTSPDSKNIQLYTGDILRLNQPGQPLADRSFNCIVISPPLDIPMKSSQMHELFPEIEPRNTSTIDSDTILAYLLQKKLTENGKGAILVSESTVTRASRKTQFLRTKLVEERETQAVIELNRPTLFPFTEERPYLLVVNKQKHESTWFLRIERDGYEASRGRDLTEAPDLSPAQNDIPFVQAVVKVTGEKLESRYLIIDKEEIILHELVEHQKKPIGVVIQVRPEARIGQIFYEQSDPLSTQLQLYVEKNKISSRQDINLPFSKHDKDERRLIFQNGKPGQMIALSLDGRLLGVTASVEEIIANKYDLRPDTYFKQHLPENEPRPLSVKGGSRLIKATTSGGPATIPFTTENEVLITQSLDEIAEVSPSQEQAVELPKAPSLPPLLVPVPDSLYPFSLKQREIWEYIKGEYSTEKYAVFFSEDQLIANFAPSDILSTLDQLERLGLIVRTRIQHKEDDTPAYYYRRVLTTNISHISVAIRETLSEEIKNVLAENTSDNRN